MTPGPSFTPSAGRARYVRLAQDAARARYARVAWPRRVSSALYPVVFSASRLFIQYVLAGVVLAVIVWAYLLMVLLAPVAD